MNYPGSKAASGAYQQIINQIPPHSVFVEAFGGSAAVTRKKLPSRSCIVIERDVDQCRKLSLHPSMKACHVINGDAIQLLPAMNLPKDAFIYLDPPYLHSTRRTNDHYRYELDELGHIAMLDVARSLDCMVAISGYSSSLYTSLLPAWRTVSFGVPSRHGRRVETLWMNYAEPTELHDYRFVGSSYRERERVKRKASRWASRIMTMPARERHAIYDLLKSTIANDGAAVPTDMTMNPGETA